MTDFNRRFVEFVAASKEDIRYQLVSALYQMGRYNLEFDLRMNELALMSPEDQKIGVKSLLAEIGSAVTRNESQLISKKEDPMEI